MGKAKLRKMQETDKKLWEVIPLIGILFFIPLIVYIKVIEMSGNFYDAWTGIREYADFYSYWKVAFLLTFTVIALGIYSVKVYQSGFNFGQTKIYGILLLLYAILIILSTIFSKYPDLAFVGIIDRHEGMLVLLAYCFLCVYTYSIMNSVHKARWLVIALMSSSVIIFVIGIFQFFEMDLYKSDFGLKMILGSYYEKLKHTMTFTIGNNAIYASLYHYNYVGSFVALIVPLFFILSIFTKDLKLRICFAITFFMGLFVLFASQARSGLVGFALVVLVIILLFFKRIFKNKKAIILVGISLVVVGIFGMIAKDALKERIEPTKNEILAIVNSMSGNYKENPAEMPLQDLKVERNKTTIITNTQTLILKLNRGGEIAIEDKLGNSIPFEFDDKNGKLNLLNPDFREFTINVGKIDKAFIIEVNRPQVSIFLDVTEDVFKLINKKGEEIQFKPVERWGFYGIENFASQRGYIWSRTIPLLKGAIFLGYGPETFVFYFPQYDFQGKIKAYKDMWMFVDKPHNFYLNIAYGTGVLSLVAVLLLFGVYIVSSFRLYYRSDFSQEEQMIGLGIFLGVCGYLGTGFFNDSMVGVAPIFWILLGCGVGLNHLVRKNQQAGA